jgi:hypothetical protein
MADSLDTRNLPKIAEALDALCAKLTARLAELEKLAAAQHAALAGLIRESRS